MTIQITDELLAAYAEGKVTVEELNAVRRYLALHPEELDILLMLIDDSEILDEEPISQTNRLAQANQSFSDIALASAAFAPQVKGNPKGKSFTGGISVRNRRKRMTDFWNELELGV